jgi:3-isopropylmalate dehydrogenase
MMLRYSFHMETAANAVETAIEKVLKRGYRTPELPGKSHPTTTSRMGDLIAEATQKILRSSKS